MSVIKCKIISVTDGEYQKIVDAIGRASSEEINDRSYFQHVGFTSIPPADTVGVMITDGNNYTMIATADPSASRPALSNEKDVAIYADADNYIKINGDTGEITVENDNNKITLKANGDIEIGGSGLKKLMTESMITAYNTHVHSGVTVGAGSTGVPTALLSTAAHATQKTEAQ